MSILIWLAATSSHYFLFVLVRHEMCGSGGHCVFSLLTYLSNIARGVISYESDTETVARWVHTTVTLEMHCG